MIDPAPLLDRALKRLSDALATRAPDAAPATPQTPPRPVRRRAKGGDGRARALRRDAAQAARGLYDDRRHLKVQASAAVARDRGREDFSPPARRQAHPVGRSPRGRGRRGRGGVLISVPGCRLPPPFSVRCRRRVVLQEERDHHDRDHEEQQGVPHARPRGWSLPY